MSVQTLQSSARLIGRLALASLFVLGAINKIINWDDTLASMENVGLSPAILLLPMTVCLELFGGLALAYGRRPWIWSGFILAAFTITTNIYFHRFWELSGDIRALELSLFFKNIAIAGGLVTVATMPISHKR